MPAAWKCFLQIDNKIHARYRKRYAVLVPVALPTLLAGAAGQLTLYTWQKQWWQLGTFAGALVGLAAFCYYPRRGHLHGWAAGMMGVLMLTST